MIGIITAINSTTPESENSGTLAVIVSVCVTTNPFTRELADMVNLPDVAVGGILNGGTAKFPFWSAWMVLISIRLPSESFTWIATSGYSCPDTSPDNFTVSPGRYESLSAVIVIDGPSCAKDLETPVPTSRNNTIRDRNLYLFFL